MRRGPVLLPILAVLLIALLGAARLGGVVAQDASPAASPSGTPASGTPSAGTPDAATPATAATGEGVAVDIRDFAFGPATLEIPVGTTVTWTNGDSAAHTVVDDGGAFASDGLLRGDTFSYAFEETGSFPYHCGFHPFMKATVTVG